MHLALADRSGNRKVLPEASPLAFHPRFNQDDSRIAVPASTMGNPNIWIYEMAQSQWRQLTFNGGDRPEWTPDGRAITYRNGTSLWQIPSDFSGAAEPLPGTDARKLGPIRLVARRRRASLWGADGLHAFRPKAASRDALARMRSS